MEENEKQEQARSESQSIHRYADMSPKERDQFLNELLGESAEGDLLSTESSPEDSADLLFAEDEELPEKETQKTKKKSLDIEFWEAVRFFSITFLIFYTLMFIFPPYLVSGTSMTQTLEDKAFGFGCRFSKLERGDIVVFSGAQTVENGEEMDYIKRIIGLPGETVTIIGDEVYIDGALLEEDYAYFNESENQWLISRFQNFTMTYELGDDEYLVLGDNRYGSRDSRIFGPITKDEIKCEMKVFFWGKH